MNKRVIFWFFSAIFFLFSQLAFAETQSENQPIWQQFLESDPNSTLRINHQPLTDYLETAVFPVGRSYRILGNKKPSSYKASRIKTAKPLSPSRFEGSRLFLHAFSNDHKVFFRAYQEGLERLSKRRSLKQFNLNEQLAYWLNLYNVIVINKLVDEYPIQNLKNLRDSKRGKSSFWSKKVTTVEGIALSLSDIENILFAKFETPLVAFGLFQGSIGGPRILNHAFTGGNVWPSLEKNAVEFVNSNRGLRPPTGTKMIVSRFYKWVEPAFGSSEENILLFIKDYADPNFIKKTGEVEGLKFKSYNWAVADVRGGSIHSGQKNQLGGVLNFGPGNQVGLNGPGEVLGNSSFPGIASSILELNISDNFGGVPVDSIDFVIGIRKNTKLPIPIFSIEECGPKAVCTIENIDLGEGA